MKYVYIAGAYTGKTKEERDLNIAHAEAVGREIARKGKFPVIPHKNTRQFDDSAPDIDKEFWLKGDIGLMLKCDAVIFIEGWEHSLGAVAEMEEAKNANMLIYCQTFAKVIPNEETDNEGL